MVKKILKESLVIILLGLLVLALLGVILYEYNPINKEVPSTITYQMPEELSNVKATLDESLPSEENEDIIKTYELTSNDFRGYEKTNYDAGKVNPFEKISDSIDGNTTSGGNQGNNINNNTSGYMGNKTVK